MAAVVPTITQRSVLPEVAPTPFTSPSIADGSFGTETARAQQRLGATIQQAGEFLTATLDKIQADKNATDFDQALLEYDTQAQTLLSGEGGLYQRQGKAAVDHGVEVTKQLAKVKEGILSNTALHPEARRAVQTSIARRELDYTGQVASYVGRQRTVFEDEVSAAKLNEALDSATANFRDTPTIQSAINTVKLQLQFDADRNGWDETIRVSKTEEAISTVLVGVIDQYLSAGDVGGAQRFFKANKKGIDGKNHGAIEREFLRERKAREAELADTVRDAVGILGMGKQPVGLDALQKAVKGSKYEKVLTEAVQDRAAVEEFIHKPLTNQAEELRRLTLQETFTPEEARRYQGMAQAHATIIKRLDAGDGLALAQELDVINTPTKLDINNPDSLKSRRREAELASDHFGITIGPLTAGEISGLASQLETATADEAAGLLGSLHAGFGDLALQIAGELSKGERPEYGSAMLLAGEGPQAMQEAIDIVLGGRQRRELGGNLKLTPEDKRPLVADVLGNMFEGLEGEPLNEFIAAADALYTARRAATGDLEFDADTYEQALRDALGGVIEFNGRKIIPPSFNMDESDLRSFVRSLTDADLVRFSVSGGIPFAGDQPFSVSLFSRSGPLGVLSAEAQLVSVGPGIYRVSIPGVGFVQDGANGLPYEIDLKTAISKMRKL